MLLSIVSLVGFPNHAESYSIFCPPDAYRLGKALKRKDDTMAQPDLTRDAICVSEMILDTSAEQSVELDYFLPDYYPNIFKILKTSITPAIQSQKIAANKLTLDGIACIRVHYLAENTNRICCVEQKTPFSKTVELPSQCQNPLIQVTSRCYFASGRAVNQRRLDIRGGISCKIRVLDQREETVTTGGSGQGIQCHCRSLTACSGRKTVCKPFVVTEDLELGAAKPAFGSLLGIHSTAVPTECRLITNKAICKGDLNLHLFYQPEEEDAAPEVMDFSIPVSQIADLPGVEEDYICDVCFQVTGVSIEAKPDESGKNRILSCEFTACLFCVAERNQEYRIVDDAYSTAYESALVSRQATAERALQVVGMTLTTQHTLDSGGTGITAVYDAEAVFGDATVKQEQGELFVCGNLEATVFCMGGDGIPFVIEKTIPVELKCMSGLDSDEVSFLPTVQVLSVGFSILSENQLELRTELRISGMAYQRSRFQAVSDISVKEDAPKVRDALCALRICYADAGDRIWEIAKSYSTSMSAVMEENGLEDEVLPEHTMLLIPLIDG